MQFFGTHQLNEKTANSPAGMLNRIKFVRMRWEGVYAFRQDLKVYIVDGFKHGACVLTSEAGLAYGIVFDREVLNGDIKQCFTFRNGKKATKEWVIEHELIAAEGNVTHEEAVEIQNPRTETQRRRALIDKLGKDAVKDWAASPVNFISRVISEKIGPSLISASNSGIVPRLLSLVLRNIGALVTGKLQRAPVVNVMAQAVTADDVMRVKIAKNGRIVQIIGLPSSGKSTMMKYLTEQYGCLGIEVDNLGGLIDLRRLFKKKMRSLREASQDDAVINEKSVASSCADEFFERLMPSILQQIINGLRNGHRVIVLCYVVPIGLPLPLEVDATVFVDREESNRLQGMLARENHTVSLEEVEHKLRMLNNLLPSHDEYMQIATHIIKNQDSIDSFQKAIDQFVRSGLRIPRKICDNVTKDG